MRLGVTATGDLVDAHFRRSEFQPKAFAPADLSVNLEGAWVSLPISRGSSARHLLQIVPFAPCCIGGYCEPVMKKSSPKSDGSSFLLCEDVREEVNNKLSIIGVFPNDEIVLQKDVLIPSLMAVLFARGGIGSCETRVALTDPKGQTVIESPKQLTILEKDKVHLAAIRVLAPELTVGRYTIKFFFDDAPIQRTFEVKTA
jgi:hypothetical protein